MKSNNQNYRIDSNSIIELLGQQYKDKEIISTKMILQILSLKSSGTKLFACKCSDQRSIYTFVLPNKIEGVSELKVNDIIEIKSIIVARQKTNSENIIYVIKDFVKLSSAPSVLYPNAIEYKKQNELHHNQNNQNINKNNHPNENGAKKNNPKNYVSNKKTLHQNISPLSQLTIFSQDFTVYVKIKSMEPLKKLYTKKGETSLLKCIVFDEDGYEMELVAFGDQADKLGSNIIEGGTYYLKGCYVKTADKRYSHLSSDYSLNYGFHASFEKAKDSGNFQAPVINIRKLEELPNISIGTCINILCVIINYGEKKELTNKKGEPFSLRQISVGDSSGYMCDLTVWNQMADQIESKKGFFYLITNVKVSDFHQKRKLDTTFASKFINEDQITNREEYQSLKQIIGNNDISQIEWKDLGTNLGKSYPSFFPKDISYLRECLNEIDENSGDRQGENKKLVLTAFRLYHSEKNYYTACPIEACKRKKVVLDPGSGKYLCTKCGQYTESPYINYVVNCGFRDASGEVFLEFFGDLGEKYIGIKADLYKEYIESSNDDELNKISNNLLFNKYVIYGNCKVNSYNQTFYKRIHVATFQKLEGKFQYEEYKSLATSLRLRLFGK